MMALLLVPRWLLFFLLFWGACWFVRERLHLQRCFAPIVTLCTMALLTYCGGLLDVLRPAAYGVLALCALCTIFALYHRLKTPKIRSEFPLIPVLFLLGLLAFGGLLWQNTLVHYDNFTHWALVVKELLITHAFPTPDSALIEFTNYPTGAACLIYLICTVVGHGENTMILAQGLLIFAAFYAMFGVIAERGRFLLVVTLAAGLSLLSLFNFAVRINNLLVDFLLPTLTLAALALLYRHRYQPNTLMVAVIPILGLLVVIKSTGILFAAIALLYLGYLLMKATRRGLAKPLALCGKAALTVGLCLLPLMGWNHRMSTVFAGVSNKFETDVTLLNTGYGGKTPQEVGQIIRLFFSTITDVTQRATIGILLFQILAMVACFIAWRVLKRKWVLPKVLLTMDVVLVAYLGGILAMYIFSMPMEEAAYLAAFDRYASSIVVLFGGVLVLCFTIDMERSFYYRLGEVADIRSFKTIQTKTLYLRSCVACVILLSLVLTSEYNGMQYQTRQDQDCLPHAVKAVVGDNWSSEVDDARYLFFASDHDMQVTSYYFHYIARYYLRANQVDAICLFYEDNFLNLLSQYDYLVIVETSSQAQDLMQRYLGLSGLPGVYDLSNL